MISLEAEGEFPPRAWLVPTMKTEKGVRAHAAQGEELTFSGEIRVGRKERSLKAGHSMRTPPVMSAKGDSGKDKNIQVGLLAVECTV